MVVVFFCALILPHTGSGPFWEWKVGMEQDYCANNWWTNLLFVNNFVNLDRIVRIIRENNFIISYLICSLFDELFFVVPLFQCLFLSWYSSVDFQLFALALIVTYLFWRMPRKYGYTFLCAIIIGGCIVPFVNTYVYGVQPLYIGFLS